MAFSDYVGPTAVAAGISGLIAYVVARVTSKTEIRKAEIGAETERLRIAEETAKRRDTRRDLARDPFNACAR